MKKLFYLAVASLLAQFAASAQDENQVMPFVKCAAVLNQDGTLTKIVSEKGIWNANSYAFYFNVPGKTSPIQIEKADVINIVLHVADASTISIDKIAFIKLKSSSKERKYVYSLFSTASTIPFTMAPYKDCFVILSLSNLEAGEYLMWYDEKGPFSEAGSILFNTFTII